MRYGRRWLDQTASRPCDLLLDGLSLLFTDGRVEAAPVLERAAARFAGGGVSTKKRSAGDGSPRLPPSWLGLRDCLAVAAREVELARDSGALAVLAVGVNVFAQAVALGGDFEKA